LSGILNSLDENNLNKRTIQLKLTGVKPPKKQLKISL